MSPTVQQFLKPIIEAMDACEEIGGPEGMDYLMVMRAVKLECEKRALNYRERHSAENQFRSDPEEMRSEVPEFGGPRTRPFD